MNNNNALWIAIVVIALALGGIAFYLFGGRMMGQPPAEAPGNGGVACTMEARQCPDGSYVGRTGPNCEFAACPGGIDINVQY
jgi:hypothetical protein